MMLKLHSQQYSWDVKVFLLTPGFAVGPVLTSIHSWALRGEDCRVASSLVTGGQYEWGFTFTSPSRNRTLMVIGPCRDVESYLNTIVHETYHLAKHMAHELGLDPFSEEVAYIAGDAVQEIYRYLTYIC